MFQTQNNLLSLICNMATECMRLVSGCLIILISSSGTFAQSVRNESIEIYFTQNINQLYDHGQLPVYATGGNMAQERILSLIRNATTSLDVAMYNNNMSSLTSALHQAKNRGVTVRYIAEGSTGNSALNGSLNFPVLYANSTSGLMHNKFIIADAAIADQAVVFTGSANFTSNSFNDDANNMIILKNQEIALAFTTEFNEMWGSSGTQPGNIPRFGASKTDNTPHTFEIDGIPVKLYFSPSDRTTEKIRSAIDEADHDIRFAIFTFTHNELASDLVAQKNSGLAVRGIMDNNEFNSKINYFKQNGVDVLDHKPSSILHHKYAVIDAAYPGSDPTVITGSHNWTYSAETINDENTLFIYDYHIALLYEAEFNSRFCELAIWDCEFLNQQKMKLHNFQVYPTLVYDRLHIERLSSEQHLQSLSVFNNLGAPLMYRHFSPAESVSNHYQLDVSGLQPGNYFLHTRAQTGAKQAFKFVKF